MGDKNNLNGWELAEEKELLKTSLGSIWSGPAKCRRSGREKEFFCLILQTG